MIKDNGISRVIIAEISAIRFYYLPYLPQRQSDMLKPKRYTYSLPYFVILRLKPYKMTLAQSRI